MKVFIVIQILKKIISVKPNQYNIKIQMKIIAYYLPQFHPIEENNLWWGEGFTEWTNVSKAKKYFPGHYQPKIPKDLGFYDLRCSETQELQAKLAKEAGVDAFCYWHYWFGNGKQLLEKPLQQVMKNKTPDLPFCIGWANETWMSKVWDSSKSKKDKILIEQLYPGTDDYVNHFNSILPILKDDRYLKIDGSPVFVLYKPLEFDDCKAFIELWNDLAVKAGFKNGIHFVGYANYDYQVEPIIKLGFNAVNMVRLSEFVNYKKFRIKNIWSLFLNKYLKLPMIIHYSQAIKYFCDERDKNDMIYPTLLPNWDHTPRSGNRGLVLHKSTPALFYKHVVSIFRLLNNKPESKQIVFLKSWNEWGEGNYLEPDLKYGKEYINMLAKAKQEFNIGEII